VPLTSITFVFYFLPVFLLLYLAAVSTAARNLVLVAASLLFYAWGDFGYLWVVIASIAVNYVVAVAISSRPKDQRRILLWAGIGLNVAGLIALKYAAFLLEASAPVLRLMNVSPPGLKMVLPLGISFFTFKAISYLADVSRGDAKAERNPVAFAAYLAMFPQLLAGPIMRFTDAERELHKRSITASGFRLGLEHLLIGLAAKLLIADKLAGTVDRIFSLEPAALTSATAWLGAICYTAQIYFDFSGYTNIAIGLGYMLGFRFPRNFNFPYVSQSVTEFWRRWHITLSTWFRDYVFFPLGANRRGPLRTYTNLLIVFTLCGLWHGANYTFLLWGLWHGALLAVERAGWLKVLKKAGPALANLYALLAIILGWVVFRSPSVNAAGTFLRAMAGFGDPEPGRTAFAYVTPLLVATLALGVVFSVPWIPKLRTRDAESEFIIGRLPEIPALAASAAMVLLLMICIFALAASSHNPFIYLRF
jgi:alginate O-acetyltransferase complex protein AlgI